MMDLISGRVWKYGDDVNTDVIFPGKYTYTITDPENMRLHALEDLDPAFRNEVQPGDIIVAGKNWGCGSSREQAVSCLKAAGVGAIIAKSFARIYYRNCLNSALPALTCPELVDLVTQGDELSVNLPIGTITFRSRLFSFPALPEALQALFSAGGLVPYTRQRLQATQGHSEPHA
jgi:3-isopropylmalate/(R)-2-methylmalate dehydratase small subunit